MKYLHTKGIRESLPIGSSELKFKCEIEKQLGSPAGQRRQGEEREVKSAVRERKYLSGSIC